jgi:hypothetical protein
MQWQTDAALIDAERRAQDAERELADARATIKNAREIIQSARAFVEQSVFLHGTTTRVALLQLLYSDTRDTIPCPPPAHAPVRIATSVAIPNNPRAFAVIDHNAPQPRFGGRFK